METLADSFRGSMFSFDSSQKGAHVRDMAAQYEREASHETREKLVQTIFEQLKARRDK